jgi:hypothetical protein
LKYLVSFLHPYDWLRMWAEGGEKEALQEKGRQRQERRRPSTHGLEKSFSYV